MNASTDKQKSSEYQVVALKYRPGDFSDLIGQTQVSTALKNAIQQNRVGHAYLFTGARGVGKTSSARIFAKCLNCKTGPTTEPCGECDICQSVSTGEDVDVLEIDGASNRGIDEIRQLRANANVRPSRSRYKIYIIDEVHMLTIAAFNALLKTLEEPPSHVKFIFCTTDPEKIPITVLSRCQRFDFPPIKTQSIVERLKHIVASEGVDADEQALELLARRAGGSMRDSQSLLEQLLSYSDQNITVKEVHSLLGTADNDAVFEIAEAMVANDSAAALASVHQSMEGGVDAGQLTSQLLGLFRDTMASIVGCKDELLLNCSSDDVPRLQKLAGALGVEKVLAILQVLDQTLVKIRHSTSVRTMLETAVVRCCHLQNLDSIPQLIQQLQSGPAARPQSNASASAKKKLTNTSADSSANATIGAGSTVAGTSVAKTNVPTNVHVGNKVETSPDPTRHSSQAPAAGNVDSMNNTLGTLPPKQTSAQTAEPERSPNRSVKNASDENTKNGKPNTNAPDSKAAAEVSTGATSHLLSPENLESSWMNILAEFNDLTSEAAGNFESLQMNENCLVVTVKSEMDLNMCNRPAPKLRLEDALKTVTGNAVKIEFQISANPEVATKRAQPVSRRQRIRNLEQNEFVKAAMDMFDAEVTDVSAPRGRK